MTRVQFQYFQVIRDYIMKHGHCPTYRQIGKLVGGRSIGAVFKAVEALLDQGYLTRTSGSSYCNLSVVPEKMKSLSFCERGHERIWYMASRCPLCDVLVRMKNSIPAVP